MKIKIIEKLLTEPEKILVEDLSMSLIGRSEKRLRENEEVPVSVEKMERFGRKAIKLLKVYLDPGMETLPFVIKISEKKEMDGEWNAATSIAEFIGEAKWIFKTQEPVQSDVLGKRKVELGALLYQDRGEQEFQELTYKRGEFNFPDVTYEDFFPIDTLCDNIDTIYTDNDLCGKAHKSAKREEISLLESLKEDKDYIREAESTPIIKSILGKRISNRTRPNFCFLGAEIYNPVKALEGLSEKAWHNVGPVHGDLHPKNIILSSPSRPHLIDFAWSRLRRPILVDYVLFENSLRFACFPRIANPDEQLEVDTALLKERGSERILHKEVRFFPHSKGIFYERLARMVQRIRENACLHGGDGYTFDEYLRAQFIVLYGLLRIDEFQTPITVRALGLIARELFEEPTFGG